MWLSEDKIWNGRREGRKSRKMCSRRWYAGIDLATDWMSREEIKVLICSTGQLPCCEHSHQLVTEHGVGERSTGSAHMSRQEFGSNAPLGQLGQVFMRIQKNRRDIGEPGKVLQADRKLQREQKRRLCGFWGGAPCWRNVLSSSG